jgi:hypothetical protein
MFPTLNKLACTYKLLSIPLAIFTLYIRLVDTIRSIVLLTIISKYTKPLHIFAITFKREVVYKVIKAGEALIERIVGFIK